MKRTVLILVWMFAIGLSFAQVSMWGIQYDMPLEQAKALLLEDAFREVAQTYQVNTFEGEFEYKEVEIKLYSNAEGNVKSWMITLYYEDDIDWLQQTVDFVHEWYGNPYYSDWEAEIDYIDMGEGRVLYVYDDYVGGLILEFAEPE